MLDLLNIEEMVNGNEKASEYFELAEPLLKKITQEVSEGKILNESDGQLIINYVGKALKEIGYSEEELNEGFINLIKKAIGQPDDFQINEIAIITREQYDKKQYGEGACFIIG